MSPRALCFQHPEMELWFSTSRSGQERAKAYCRVCPVRLRCLNAAKGRKERYGVWGGEVFG